MQISPREIEPTITAAIRMHNEKQKIEINQIANRTLTTIQINK